MKGIATCGMGTLCALGCLVHTLGTVRDVPSSHSFWIAAVSQRRCPVRMRTWTVVPYMSSPVAYHTLRNSSLERTRERGMWRDGGLSPTQGECGRSRGRLLGVLPFRH